MLILGLSGCGKTDVSFAPDRESTEQSMSEENTQTETEEPEPLYSVDYANQTRSNAVLGDIISDDENGLIVNVSTLSYAYLKREDILNAAVGDILIASDGVAYECTSIFQKDDGEITVDLYCDEYGWEYYASSDIKVQGMTGIAIIDMYNGTDMTEKATEENTKKIKIAPDAIAKVYLDTNVAELTEVSLCDLLRNPEDTLGNAQLMYPLTMNSRMTFNEKGELYTYEMKWWS